MEPVRCVVVHRVLARVVAAALVVGFALLAAPASSLGATTTRDAGVYPCIHNPQTKNDANWDPNNDCAAKFAIIGKGTPTTMICWQDGRVPSGQKSPRWFYVKAKNTSGTTSVGFVYSVWIAPAGDRRSLFDAPRDGHDDVGDRAPRAGGDQGSG